MFPRFIILLFVIFPLPGLGQDLRISYAAPWGVNTMSYGGKELINLGKGIGRGFGPETFKLITGDKKVVTEWSHYRSHSWDAAKKEYKGIFNWGSALVRYRQVNDTLFLDITLTNERKSDIFCGMSFCPLTFNFGKRPNNFQPNFPYITDNINTLGVVRAELDNYHLIVENTAATKKVYMGLLEENHTNGSVFRLWNGNIPFNGMQHFNPEVELRLAPGKSFSYTMAMKFTKPGTSTEKAAANAVANFRKRRPFEVQWTDRRPIGTLFLSSFTGQKYPNNPRNWSMVPQSQLNIKTKQGLLDFRLKSIQYANTSIKNLKDADAQGMITWDIEGQEFPHPLSYIGSPELIKKLAPEMDKIADEYFRMFRKAGLKTGICIRPDSVRFISDGRWIEHIPVKDPYWNLLKKIRYARDRWGCTIFYIDSNIDPTGQPMDYSIFKRLNEACPGILLIPEHERLSYYGYTAPFSDLKFEPILLSEEVKAAYPQAFMVINVPEGLKGTEVQNLDNLYKSLQQGNILLFRPWYDDQPTTSLIKKAWKRYSNARSK